MKGRRQHTDKVTVLEVVTIQLVARLLCIHYVFIDNEGSALGIAGNTLSNLTVRGVRIIRVIVAGVENTYRIGPYFPKRSKSSSGVTL